MIFKSFYTGESISPYIIQDFQEMINVDPFSELGTVKPQYALQSKTSIIDEPTISVVLGSLWAKKTYYFSIQTGKIWSKDFSGTETLVRTATDPIMSAHYFKANDTKEYIYFTSLSYLGVYDISTNTWTDHLQSLNWANSHNITLIDGELFICNGSKIGRVDATNTWTDNTLDLPANYKSQDVYFYSTSMINDLVVIANPTNGYSAKLFRWNTTDDSWNYEDEIFEHSLERFIPVDNSLLVLATSGAIYEYTGRTLNQFTIIDPITERTSVTVGNQRSYLSHGNQIRSFNKPAKDFALATVIEYTATDTISDINSADGTLIVSTYSGLNEISSSRATATITTPVFVGRVKEVRVGYAYNTDPDDIELEYNLDNDGFADATSVDRTDDYRIKQSIDSPQVKRQIEVKVTFKNDTVIDSIELLEE